MNGRIIRTDNMSLAAEIVRLHGDVGNLLDTLETQMEINKQLLYRIYTIEEKLNGLSDNEPGAVPPDSKNAPAGTVTERTRSELGGVSNTPQSGDGYPYG